MGPNICLFTWMNGYFTNNHRNFKDAPQTILCPKFNPVVSTLHSSGTNAWLNQIFMLVCCVFDNGTGLQTMLFVGCSCMAPLWIYVQWRPEKFCPLATALCKLTHKSVQREGVRDVGWSICSCLVEHSFNLTQDSIDLNWLWTELSLFLLGFRSVYFSFTQKDLAYSRLHMPSWGHSIMPGK